MSNRKQHYEAPVTDVWEVRTECGILQGSPAEEISAMRNGYGTASTDSWD